MKNAPSSKDHDSAYLFSTENINLLVRMVDGAKLDPSSDLNDKFLKCAGELYSQLGNVLPVEFKFYGDNPDDDDIVPKPYGWTKLPHWVVDNLYPCLTPRQQAINTYLLRLTLGWNRQNASVSLENIRVHCDSALKPGGYRQISKDLKKLEDLGLWRISRPSGWARANHQPNRYDWGHDLYAMMAGKVWGPEQNVDITLFLKWERLRVEASEVNASSSDYDEQEHERSELEGVLISESTPACGDSDNLEGEQDAEPPLRSVSRTYSKQGEAFGRSSPPEFFNYHKSYYEKLYGVSYVHTPGEFQAATNLAVLVEEEAKLNSLLDSYSASTNQADHSLKGMLAWYRAGL